MTRQITDRSVFYPFFLKFLSVFYTHKYHSTLKTFDSQTNIGFVKKSLSSGSPVYSKHSEGTHGEGLRKMEVDCGVSRMVECSDDTDERCRGDPGYIGNVSATRESRGESAIFSDGVR